MTVNAMENVEAGEIRSTIFREIDFSAICLSSTPLQLPASSPNDVSLKVISTSLFFNYFQNDVLVFFFTAKRV